MCYTMSHDNIAHSYAFTGPKIVKGDDKLMFIFTTNNKQRGSSFTQYISSDFCNLFRRYFNLDLPTAFRAFEENFHGTTSKKGIEFP